MVYRLAAERHCEATFVGIPQTLPERNPDLIELTIAGKSEPNDPPTVQAPNSVLIDPSRSHRLVRRIQTDTLALPIPIVGDGREPEPREPRPFLHYQPMMAILYTTRMGTVASANKAESV